MKKQKKKQQKKQPYTIQVDDRHSQRIREYIQKNKETTGRSKRVIATELLLTGMSHNRLKEQQNNEKRID